jgi:hypothetical protein
MSHSGAIETAVTGWITSLEHVHDRIQSCHVWVEAPSRNHRNARQFQIRIVLAVPGRSIVVAQGDGAVGHDDVFVALADAFLAARRQLQDFTQIRRGETKAHAA